MLSTSHSHPISYTKDLSGAELRRRNERDIAQNVTRTFVNAGRLLRSLVDPAVKLTWRRQGTCPMESRDDVKFLYWKPSRHQVRKDSRDHRHYRDYRDYRQAGKQAFRLNSRPRSGQLSPQEKDHAYSQADAMLGPRTGTDKKGLHRLALEAHAQEVIEAHLQSGAIAPEQYQMLERAQHERLQEIKAELTHEKEKLEKELPEKKKDHEQSLKMALETKALLEPRLAEALKKNEDELTGWEVLDLKLLKMAMKVIDDAPEKELALEEESKAQQQRLEEIAQELEMKTSFVSLPVTDRLACLGRELHFELLAAIGDRWIANQLTGDDFPAATNRPAILEQQEQDDLQIHRFEPLDAGKLE